MTGCQAVRQKVSGNNGNVRILGTVEMSADRTVSLVPLEPLSPGVIFGWTPPPRLAILRRAVGRIGLRRSATRAPAGRLHASGPGLLWGAPAFVFHPAIT